ncbi:hypothetical protein F5Y10DRAFT_22181 [Nemania abortiva]|nr:hypothetical protein F5Y10DRAFT_22181 [Nemania abortiva]
MCYEQYKGYPVCQHADPQSTPTELKQCDDVLTTGVCKEGKKYVLVASEATPALCPGCWELEGRLEDAIGSLDDARWESPTWRLWYRIGWAHKEVMLVLDAMYMRSMLYREMFNWEGNPHHTHQALIAHWTDIFDEFKDWLAERLEKRNTAGQLYFPPGEEKGARIEKKKVLQHLVRWTVVKLAQGKFNQLDTVTFREGLDKAFNNLIYQWDTHFPEEPGCDCAKEEFTKYWVNWFGKREHAHTLTQGEGESAAS